MVAFFSPLSIDWGISMFAMEYSDVSFLTDEKMARYGSWRTVEAIFTKLQMICTSGDWF